MLVKTIMQVDSNVRIPKEGLPESFLDVIKREFTVNNPDYHKNRLLKIPGWWNTPEEVGMWWETDSHIILPRGCLRQVRDLFESSNRPYGLKDRRSTGAIVADFPNYIGHPMRYYQEEAIGAAMEKQNCILRLPTASGKSVLVLALASRIQLNTLVVLPTVALFKQWCEDARSSLDLGRDGLGIIHQKKRVLRPVTAAVQGTLASQGIDQELKDFFGVVVFDECFVRGTLVLMADGSLKSIEDIEAADVTAVGGRVLRTMSKFYLGPLYKVGDAFTTEEHPIATQRGWVTASTIRSSDVLWYDPKHEERKALFHLRRPYEIGFKEGFVCPTFQGSLQERMSDLQEAHTTEASWRSRGYKVRFDRTMEQRLEGFGGSSLGSDGGSTTRNETSVVDGTMEEVLRGPEKEKEVARESDQGAQGARLDSRDAFTCSFDDEASHEAREDSSVWWTRAWEWGFTDSIGRADDRLSGASGLCFSVRGWNGKGSTEQGSSQELQDRLGASIGQSWNRAGWQQSHRIETISGRAEDRLPHVEGVVDISLPGSVRLAKGRPQVHAYDAVETACVVYNLETERNVYVAGGVLVHNCQLAAARTYVSVIDPFPAKYRIGVSADERRKDRKEYLTKSLFGAVAYQKSRKDLEDEGFVNDVDIRVVPTKFRADWYGMPKSKDDEKEIDFNRLLEEMTHDDKRNELSLQLAYDEIKKGNQVLVLSHRVEHCQYMQREFVKQKIPSGFFLGGAEYSKEFEETRHGINSNELRAGVGTYKALGVGVNLPEISVGVATTPIAGNSFFLNQVRGRLSRMGKGKKEKSRLYVLWDKAIYPGHLKTMMQGNPTVTVLHNESWMAAKDYVKKVGSK